jgi:predicted nucleic acid-binding protein
MSFPAFLDTCTLFGAALNDLLLELAERGAYRPLWSAHVLKELERNLTDKRIGAQAARNRIAAMQYAFPDAEVTGYDDLIDGLRNDPKDRHVLAAAIRANAEVIVTFNLRDFPEDALVGYDLEVIHPDEFLLDQLDLYPSLTLLAVDEIASAYENPAMTTEEYLERLRSAGTPMFADAVLDRI